MENKKSLNLFEEVHRQVRERLDLARVAREQGGEVRKKQAEEEAIREGFDRPFPGQIDKT